MCKLNLRLYAIPAWCFFFGLLFSDVLAAPANSLKCVTHASGYLTTSELSYGNDNNTPTGVWKPYSLNSRKELAYWNTTGHGTIWAQFQTCTPNYAGGTNKPVPGFPSESTYYGRVYIPNLNLCLAVTNPESRVGPYYAKALPCLNSATGEMKGKKSIPYNFSFRTFSQDTSRKLIFWIGKSRADGTNPQGECEGSVFGYEWDDQHVPITTSRNRVSLIDVEPPALFMRMEKHPSQGAGGSSEAHWGGDLPVVKETPRMLQNTK
ncbi:uncharacterized protein EI90DRAFT_3011527 [Cantharellus anzutake]|uniref:uncharacterized protein n=1 Tax=Cantharellus anzutake TaxID=1750568 RepID=UPI001903D803|nr:uncharacterized protein EI90DRAFT_3011527 [Cantharellus anzutake]KAF8343154.1 hypothetical protein EI90DRAFT_3011527 [Cantharellus anzutake]